MPGSRVTPRGPRSHSWSPGKLCKYELMSSLIASRINSSDIILEFQIPALERHNKIQTRLIITGQTWCPGNSDFTLNDGQRSQQYYDSKAGPNSNIGNRFLPAHLWSRPGPVITSLSGPGSPHVCPLLVSPRNCPVWPQLAPVPGDRDRCRSRPQRRRRPGIANNGRRVRVARERRGLSWDAGPRCHPETAADHHHRSGTRDIVNVA